MRLHAPGAGFSKRRLYGDQRHRVLPRPPLDAAGNVLLSARLAQAIAFTSLPFLGSSMFCKPLRIQAKIAIERGNAILRFVKALYKLASEMFGLRQRANVELYLFCSRRSTGIPSAYFFSFAWVSNAKLSVMPAM
jgi:hypothetical protein